MSVNCGLVGLPNVGKSTIFNSLTQANAAVANYPFCTVSPHVGMVAVPDGRLDRLAALYQPKKVTSPVLEVVDIAGLVKGASQGEGLGNQFLSHVHGVDALVHVVRCFDDSEIIHVNGEVNPKLDIEIVETELILKDLELVEHRLTRLEKKVRAGEKAAVQEAELIQHLKETLSKGETAASSPVASGGHLFVKEMLTAKPMLYVANLAEQDLEKGNAYSECVQKIAIERGAESVLMSGKIESELATLSPEEQTLFLKELGLSESGIARLARACYRLLGLITFFTVGEDEVKGWTIQRGTTACAAAGKIHSDIERGFIRAEVFRYQDLMACHDPKKIKEDGLLRLEGREYPVQDGDCIYFRFNV